MLFFFASASASMSLGDLRLEVEVEVESTIISRVVTIFSRVATGSGLASASFASLADLRQLLELIVFDRRF